MQGKENLYFIAIIPAREIVDAIRQFQVDFSERFFSSAALKTVPHLTLKAPFKLPADDHEKLLQWFHQLGIPLSSFEIELRDFGSFHNPHNPVVFVQPVLNTSLSILQQELISNFIAAYSNLPIPSFEFKYAPHLTVAFRDLQPAHFKEAWDEYSTKKYTAKFWVAGVHLLQHDGRKWNSISIYELSRGS